jgi:hypothetical protein
MRISANSAGVERWNRRDVLAGAGDVREDAKFGCGNRGRKRRNLFSIRTLRTTLLCIAPSHAFLATNACGSTFQLQHIVQRDFLGADLQNPLPFANQNAVDFPGHRFPIGGRPVDRSSEEAGRVGELLRVA